MNLNEAPSPLSLSQRLESLNIRYCTLLCLLASIDVLGPLATDAHLPSLPAMTKDLNTSPGMIQLSVLGYSLVLALSTLFGGYLSDRYGRRPVTIIGLLFFVGGGFGCSFTPNIILLNGSRFIQGFGGGISCIVTSAVARDVFLADERMKILGILGTLRPFAIAMAPMFGGWIAELSDWRMVFFVTSCIATASLMATILFLPETKSKFFVNPSNEITVDDARRPSVFRIVWSDSVLLAISAILALRMVGVFVFLNEFPFVVERVYGQNELISGVMMGTGPLFLILGASTSIALKSMSKVDIMRSAQCCSFVMCLLLVLGPVLNHWNEIISQSISVLNVYTDNKWYFLVIPRYLGSFAQGLNGPPSNVVALEPYPDIAGTVGAVLMFWRLIVPSVVMVVITQCLSEYTDRMAPIFVYLVVASTGFLCFVIQFIGPCLSRRRVTERMKGRRMRMESDKGKRLIDESLAPAFESGSQTSSEM